MDIKTLEQYYGIQSNIDAINEEIRQLYQPITSIPLFSDGSKSSTPGNPTEKTALRIIQLKERLDEETKKLYEKVIEIENWLLTVEDPEIVSIIRWHYLLRLNWKQTNMRVYGYPDYYYSRQKIIKYFEKISKISNETN